MKLYVVFERNFLTEQDDVVGVFNEFENAAQCKDARPLHRVVVLYKAVRVIQ